MRALRFRSSTVPLDWCVDDSNLRCVVLRTSCLVCAVHLLCWDWNTVNMMIERNLRAHVRLMQGNHYGANVGF